MLWTSRDRQDDSLVGHQRAVYVDHITSPEAERLLRMGRNYTASAEEVEAIQILLAKLGHLPSVISQAAAYIYRTSTAIRQYLSETPGKREAAEDTLTVGA